MKKLLCMLTLITLLVSCDNKAKFTDEQRKELSFLFSQRDLVSGAGCKDNILVIPENKFTASTISYAKFKTDNSKYLSGSFNGYKVCDSSSSYFNIIKFITKERDFSKEKFALWLQENGKHICFNQAYKLIECIHTIDDEKIRLLLESIREGEKVNSLSFNQIRDKIGGLKYDNDCYDQYLKFKIKESGVDFDLLPGFEGGGDYYSIPFIRSIYQANKLTDMDTPLEFFSIPLYSSEDQIVIAIKLGNGYKYYDFSQIPPGSGGIGSYFSFSPL
ncbi:MAG: hypothetical protein M0D53_04195 [Flavobacterium sp. JAD_PAG50586_2]|nr:MAG: hypothetical protein M0D53_04195 [Flavobacterium sp. JAD_PAG50586_2]